MLRLMKSWCLVADVHFLDPVKKYEKESAVDFAERVKTQICKVAGLINLPW